jgi:sugar-specific transcriptional regulator TrmB
MNDRNIVDQLVDLGFSQYEARAYTGLLGHEPLTGYALANHTQIPQPKVYETLRRLAEKRAVVQIGKDPATFVAVPAEHLLAQLDAEFRRRLAEAKVGLAKIGQQSDDEELRVMRSPRGWPAIARNLADLIDSAERHLYVSTHADQLTAIADHLKQADERGVRVDLLCFGRTKLELAHGRVLGHVSTEGMIYRHHQARHVALVADSEKTLWALAADGQQWDAVIAADPLIAAVVKGFVRHDLYVQEIFSDFREQLVARYGPGLDALVSPHLAATAAPVAARPTRRRKTA